MSDLGPLWQPLRVGPMEVRNRIVATSHQTGLVHDYIPTDDLIAYHVARARGGVAASFIEATAVHPTGLLTAHTIGGFLPAIVPAYRRLGDQMRAHGGRLLVQLFHGGREQIAAPPRAPSVAPSAVPSLRFKAEPRSLSLREIRELIDGFGLSARHAREGAVDGIEVSMSHGYLAAQFLAAATNRRDDGYGGNLEARLRFAREVLQAVRAETGDGLAVGVRLSADDLAPEGLDSAACTEIARALWNDGLVDFVSLVLGNSAFPAAATWIVPPPPARVGAIGFAAQPVRAALPDATLIGATRVPSLEAAADLVASGLLDLVGMPRAIIADPEFVAKARDGRREDTIECIGCNQGCVGHYHAGVPIACTVNPRTGRERTLPAATPSASSRRVLVVGAGPAGAAAALEAAALGDDVTLLERKDEIGGQLRLSGRAPAHHETWDRYLASTRRRLRRAGVDLRFGIEADVDATSGYDVVVVATGARPYAPPLPEQLPFAVVQAWDAIAAPQSIEGPVLLADWGGGWTGLDAAETLANAGLDVVHACAATLQGEAIHQYQRNLYLARLDDLDVAIWHHTELAVVAGEAVLRHVYSGRTIPLPPVRTLVLAQGREPVDELWLQLENDPRAVRAGDVLSPRSAEEAILEGTHAVRGVADAKLVATPIERTTT